MRPTHLESVLTVVAKFFALIRPDAALFGEKDYQQLTLIRRMNVDLELGVEVVGVETVREPDGLALSTRNVYLGSDDRQQALVLSRALHAGQAAAAGGPTPRRRSTPLSRPSLRTTSKCGRRISVRCPRPGPLAC